MVLELRPAHDPTKPYGFVGVVVSTADLSASVWLWHRDGERQVGVEKVITIPAEPAEAEQLPPALQPFGAVPPLVTDIALSVDDSTLYVSCWGTGELKRYDVSDPANPKETGSVRLGGIVARAPHPAAGAAQRRPADGRGQPRRASRVYLTNSLYASWDAQFYPEGIDGWMVKLDSEPNGGTFALDPDFFVAWDGASARTRSGCRAATRPRTRTASREPHRPLDHARRCSGAYHGLNPAMGWLFAVSHGMQERERRAVCRSLLPIAIGHELSIVRRRRLVVLGGQRGDRPGDPARSSPPRR